MFDCLDEGVPIVWNQSSGSNESDHENAVNGAEPFPIMPLAQR